MHEPHVGADAPAFAQSSDRFMLFTTKRYLPRRSKEKNPQKLKTFREIKRSPTYDQFLKTLQKKQPSRIHFLNCLILLLLGKTVTLQFSDGLEARQDQTETDSSAYRKMHILNYIYIYPLSFLSLHTSATLFKISSASSCSNATSSF